MNASLKQIRTREKYSKKHMTSNKFLACSLAMAIFSSFFAFQDSITKAGNYTNQIDALIAPVQLAVYPKESFIRNMNGVEVTFTKLASYCIAGRVVASHNYSNTLTDFIEAVSCKSYYNEIASKDVAIAYGPMILEENHSKMSYVMTGTRRISYAVKDTSIFDTVGSISKISEYITNNHLIPSNAEVEKLIQNIDDGDYVQISGYLVSAVWKSGRDKYEICSSLSRSDVGNNACEVIYVENIKWIK